MRLDRDTKVIKLNLDMICMSLQETGKFDEIDWDLYSCEMRK